MLSQVFDMTVATFPRFSMMQKGEVMQADLIQFREYVPGGIYHPEALVWRGSLRGCTSIESFLRSPAELTALRKNIQALQEMGYFFATHAMNDKLYKDFSKLYARGVRAHQRSVSHDLEEQIRAKMLIGSDVFLIGMYSSEGVLESGMVFHVTSKNEAHVSLSMKPKIHGLRGGVGGVLEYLFIQFCIERGVQEMSHGKGVCPAGLIATAGVFEFKARYGFSAFPTGYWTTSFLRSRKIALSDLVFITIAQSSLCYEVIGDSLDHSKKKYVTREVPEVTARSLDDVITSHQAVIESWQ